MVRVKVCGITSVEDALTAAGAGADAIGLVLAESPRRVSPQRACEISSALPQDVLKVGVFVDEEPAEVLRIAQEAGLDLVQLHGNESPREVEEIRRGGVGVVKALRVRDAASLEAMASYEVDFFLLDAYDGRVRGGSGRTFDWALANGIRGCANIFISGGLSPENVREAVEFFRPYGVDASSSLEEKPGRKSGERVRRFVRAAKG
jgi:phosphoribosylanthranilate isomerase